MAGVSRDLIRAILESRDNRHNETHAALLEIYQVLVAELLDQGAISPENLAERLTISHERITDEAHGDAARQLVSHLVSWLRSLEPRQQLPHPPGWSVPAIAVGPEKEEEKDAD